MFLKLIIIIIICYTLPHTAVDAPPFAAIFGGIGGGIGLIIIIILGLLCCCAITTKSVPRRKELHTGLFIIFILKVNYVRRYSYA